MTPILLLINVFSWAAQVAALVLVGVCAAEVFEWRHRQSRLRFFQILLAVSLLLPLIAPWSRTPIPFDGTDSMVTVRTYSTQPLPSREAPRFAWQQALLAVLAGGAVLQLLRLAIGVARLGDLRRRGTAIAIEGIVDVEVRVVAGLNGPATFGWARPVILLPLAMAAAGPVRAAALRHELQHVLRRDWLENLFERAAAALLWFHPMIWWLTERINVTREQAVDAEVAGEGAERDQYLESLLTSAGLANSPALPAHSFIRRPRHLVERVEFLTKESPMSVPRTIASAAVVTLLCAGAVALTGFLVPLRLAAQESGSDVRWTRPSKTAGTVQVEAVLDANGDVMDARVLSGPDELRKQALASVLGWRGKKSESTRRILAITIDFKELGSLPPPPPPPPAPPPIDQTVLEGIDYDGLTPELQQRAALVMAPLRSGQKLTEAQVAQLRADLQAIDPSLRLGLNMRSENSGTPTILRLSVFQGKARPEIPKQIRIGGNIAHASLIHKIAPVYPQQAKDIRLQGTVRFNIVIDREGSVESIALVSGHPMLVTPAQEAVRQWKYRPTMLNGQPTAVATVVDINFTLSPE